MNFRPEVSSLGSADPREAHRLLPSGLWESKRKRKPRAAMKCRVRTGDPSGTCSEEVPRSGGRRQNSCRRVSAGTQETWKDTRGNLLPGSMWDKHPHPEGYLRNAACSSPGVCKQARHGMCQQPLVARRCDTRCTRPWRQTLPRQQVQRARQSRLFALLGDPCLPICLESLSSFLQAARSLLGCLRLSGLRRSSTETFPSTTCVWKEHRGTRAGSGAPLGVGAYRQGGDSSWRARSVAQTPQLLRVPVPVFVSAQGRPEPK